jgi:hypothetical protein
VEAWLAFFLGMMVGWTPSLIVLAWCLLRTPDIEDQEADSA